MNINGSTNVRSLTLLGAAALLLAAGCVGSPAHTLCSDFDCSGHGTCGVEAGKDGVMAAVCTCDAGYTRSADGWLCLPAKDDALCAGVSCSGHGSCVSRAGQAACVCDQGYQASADARACLDPCQGVTCSGHGTCASSSAGASCSCDIGYHRSSDGKACESLSHGTFQTYKFHYSAYPTWQMGRLTLDLNRQAQGIIEERLDFGINFDYSGRGLRRKARLIWTLDAARRQVTAVELEDLYTQAKLKRRRWSRATFAKGQAAVTMQRLDRQASHTERYRGALAPIPMLGGFEYPGWTLGCFSPAFFMVSLARYNSALKGSQLQEVYFPSTGHVQMIRVVDDPAWTASAPVLSYPDHELRVTFNDKGLPEKIDLIGNNMSWTRYNGVPTDLNLSARPKATTVKAATLPEDRVESSVALTASDGATLACTLALPKNAAAKVPAVLLLPDPQGLDRDRPLARLPRAPLYQHLAAHLAHAGYASLRCDPRARGASQGGTGRLTLSQLTQDAGTALKLAQGHKALDSGRIFLLSWGWSSVAAANLLAQGAQVRGYVGLAPVLHDPRSVVLHSAVAQLKASGFSDYFQGKQRSWYLQRMAEIENDNYAGHSWLTLPVSLWKEYLAFRGSELLVTADAPVLLVQGDQDLETPPSQLTELAAAAKAAGKKNLTTTTLTGRTFCLTAGKKSTLWEEAFLPLDLPADARSAVINWLNKN